MNIKLFTSLAICAFFIGGSEFAFGLSGFDLGDAANYAVIFQAGGNNHLNINNGAGVNDLAVNGNIGIANLGPGSNGSLQLSGPLTINSNVDFAGAVDDNGPYSGNIHVNGTISGAHANVRTDMDTLGTLSHTLGLEGGNLVNGTGTLAAGTVMASAGMLDASGNRVFSVTGLNAPNGTLTIVGDGTHNVVFNFGLSNPNFHFNSIVLQGGLTSDNVLFNFFGGSDVSHTGGPTLDANSNFSSSSNNILQGVFLDPNGGISFVNTGLTGRIFGGDSVDEAIVSGDLINGPAGQVPDGGSAVALLGIALAGIEGVRRTLRARAKRKFHS